MDNNHSSGLSPEMLLIFETLPHPYLVLSQDLVILTASNAYLELVRRERTTIVSLPFSEVFPETADAYNNTALSSSFAEVLQTAKPHKLQATCTLFPDELDPKVERQYWLQITNTPVLDTKGNVAYILHHPKDITEQVAGEKKLLDVNEELAQANEEMQAATEETLEANKSLAKANDNLEAAIVQRTRELAITANRLNRMIMTTPIGLTIFRGHDFIIEIVNQPVLTIWGRKEKDVIGRKLLDVFPELEGQPFPDMLRGVMATGKSVGLAEIPVDVNQPDGSMKKFYVDFSYDALFDLEGKPEAILVSVKDITEVAENRRLLQQRQEELETMNEELAASNEEILSTNEELFSTNEELAKTQERLQQLYNSLAESETRFRQLIEQSPVPMMVNKGDNLIIEVVNQAMIDIVGKGPDILGKTMVDAVPEIKGQPVLDILWSVYTKGETFNGLDQPVLREINGEWSTRYYNLIYKPLMVDGKITGIIQAAYEVSEQVKARKQVEETLKESRQLSVELRASRQRLQGILDTMAEGVIIIDKDERVTYANAMAQRIFKKHEEEFKDRHYNDDKWQNIRPDGSPLEQDNHPVTVMMRTGLTVVDQEVGIQMPNEEPFFVSFNASPLYSEDGVITGGVATITDVTHRRKLMQQKDEFISVASHELKTPVTSLKAALQLLERMKDNASAEMRDKLLAQSNRSLDKLSRLIADLLNVNRISRGQLALHKTRFRVADLINDCCAHIRTAGTHDIMIKGNVQLEIEADEQQIDQVVVNLVNNAVKYAPESKAITIEVKDEDQQVRISVSDTGPGIPPEKVPHLFDRYFRADYSGMQFSGLGLGLYISSAIIEKHGGQMGVETAVDEGSTFWFTLPLSV